jgi:hypothetical protein
LGLPDASSRRVRATQVNEFITAQQAMLAAALERE